MSSSSSSSSCVVRATFQPDGAADYVDFDEGAVETLEQSAYPERLRLRLFNGREMLTFAFQQNRQLLSDDYELRRLVNKRSVVQKTTKKNRSSFCHYEGFLVDADASSHAALNICRSNINGLLLIRGQHFSLEGRDGRLLLVPSNRFSQDIPTCDGSVWPSGQNGTQSSSSGGVGPRSKRQAPSQDGTPAPRAIPDYYKQYLDGKWRYVELALVSDHAMFLKYQGKTEVIHDRMVSIANMVNSLYQPLNIRVTLVWAEVWQDADAFPITTDADQTLNLFLNYRKGMLRTHPHDNAHLITETRFPEGVVGKAHKGTMCSYDNSGGVAVNHSVREASVASTIAHEMGHNFGMEHDNDECKCPTDNNCIMAPSSGGLTPSFWSDCSLEYLKHGLARGVDYCLQNQPATDSVFGGAKCGNGVVEAGEDCDCGTTDVCTNKCCSPKTCKFVGDAVCASGPCCDVDTCKPKSEGTECRSSTNSCDLGEYCDGHTEFCPADFYVQDGLPCPNGAKNAYCSEGKCGSRDEQCQLLWGPTGQNSPDVCYGLNEKGTIHGNCGYERDTDTYSKCEKKDNYCGRLHCQHQNERTEFGDRSIVFSAHTFLRLTNGQSAVCRVVRMTYSNVNKRDPGMVPDGASCDTDKLCINAQCKPREEVLKMTSKCDPTDCHGVGVCNNVGNCHCDSGYGGTDCSIPGPGGSINSGPAYNPSSVNFLVALFMIFLFGAIIFGVFSVWYKRKRNVWPHRKILKMVRDHVHASKMPTFRKPTRKAPPPPNRPMSPTNENQQLNTRLPPSLDNATPAWQSSTLPRNSNGTLPKSNNSTLSKNNNGTLRRLEISPPMPQTLVPPAPGSDLNSPWNDGRGGAGQAHTLPGRRNVADIRKDMEEKLTVAANHIPSVPVVRQPSTLVRQPSLRPKVAPPSVPRRPNEEVLDQLYAERSTELSPPPSEAGDGSFVAEVLSAYDARVARAQDDTPPPDDPDPDHFDGHDGRPVAGAKRPGVVQRANSNASRPGKPPPPPPPKSLTDSSSAALYVDDDNYYDVIPADENMAAAAAQKPRPPQKPHLPVKPPLAAKPKLNATDSIKRTDAADAANSASVKSLAARYDPKSGNVKANLWKK